MKHIHRTQVLGSATVLVLGAACYTWTGWLAASEGKAQRHERTPVSLEEARRELLGYQLARDLGVGPDYPMELGPVCGLPFPQCYFSSYLAWQSQGLKEVAIGAYDRRSVKMNWLTLLAEERAGFYGREATREELLRSAKPDEEVDRIACDLARKHCPWFDSLNERFVYRSGFGSTYSRELWFLRAIGSTWCSSFCRVAVEVVTGRVILYEQFFAPCGVPTKPRRTREEAARLGMMSLGCRRGLFLPRREEEEQHIPYWDGRPTVTGEDALGCQRLVWVAMVELETAKGEQALVYLLVDDVTGEVLGVEGILAYPSHQEKWERLPRDPESSVERLRTYVDGFPCPVLFAPLKRGHRIYLYAEGLRPWGMYTNREGSALLLLNDAGKAILRTKEFMDRRGLLYVPIDAVLPLTGGSISVQKTKDGPSVCFRLPREPKV